MDETSVPLQESGATRHGHNSTLADAAFFTLKRYRNQLIVTYVALHARSGLSENPIAARVDQSVSGTT
jgi:hypothetical protein